MYETPNGKHENALQDESITVTVNGESKTLEEAMSEGFTASVASGDITDASTVGKAVLVAKDAATARTAIGAGTLSSVPAASATVFGTVKQSASTAAVTSPDAVAAAGDAPTKEEFGAVVALLNEVKAQLNAKIANDKAAAQSV